MQNSEPFPRPLWLRLTLQGLLALITAGLIYAIILPALRLPKQSADTPANMSEQESR
jgi:hypothetical protein